MSSRLPVLRAGTGGTGSKPGCQQMFTTRFWQGQSIMDPRAAFVLTKHRTSRCSKPALSSSHLFFVGKGNLGLVSTGDFISS